MGHTTTTARAFHPGLEPKIEFRFRSLVLTEPDSLVKGRSTTVGVSLVIHGLILLAVILVPLFYEDVLPPPSEALRAFFVSPAEVAPPPPPPPPGPRRPLARWNRRASWRPSRSHLRSSRKKDSTSASKAVWRVVSKVEFLAG